MIKHSKALVIARLSDHDHESNKTTDQI